MKLTKLKFFLAAISAGVLVACGGGGGGGGSADGGGGGVPPIVPGWQTAQALESLDLPAEGADVAINADGVGYAVWRQAADGKQGVFASRYSNGAWSAAQLVSSEALIAGSAFDPQVVALPDGEAVVLWSQSIPDGTLSVMSKRSTNGGTWTEFNEKELSINLETTDNLELVADNKGNAVAVWAQREVGGFIDDVHYSLFRNGDFEPVESITDSNAQHREPDVAIDSEGRVLIVWLENSLVNGAFANRVFVRSISDIVLSGIENLSGAVDVDASAPTVAWGPNGKAVVTWVQDLPGGGGSHTLARVSDNALADQWGAVTVLSGVGNFGFFARNPTVAMDTQGRAVAMWQQEGLVDGRDDIFAAHFDGTNWTPAQAVETQDAGDATFPQVAVDAGGQAIAVWRQDDGANINVLSARLNMASGQWSVPELIETDNTSDARLAPSLAVNAAGRAIAAWEQTLATPTGGVADSILGNVFIK